MKRIAVILSYPLCIRNFIHSGLLNELSKKGYDIRLLSPYKNEVFEDAWGNKYRNTMVPTTGWDKWGTPMIEGTGAFYRFITSLRIRGYSIEYPEGSLQMMDLAKPTSIVWFFSWLLVKFFPRRSGARKLLRRIYDRMGSNNAVIGKVMDDYKPDLLITSTMGHFSMDFIGLTSAKRHSVKTMCILLSWDNLYSRGPVYKHPDKLLVWSGIMKRQAIEVHQFASNQVEAVGPLQFVNYEQDPTPDERAAVRTKFNLKSGEKYVLYVCGGRTPRYDIEDITELVKVLGNSEYRDRRIIVRPHPQVDAAQYDAVSKMVDMDYSPSLIGVKDPGKLFGKADIRHFASLLCEAEYVVSSWGTTALLEGCIFDKKVVQLNWFDSVTHKEEAQTTSVRNFQKYYHMKQFDQYNGRLFSLAPSDLISKFHQLDNENDKLTANRKKIREDFTLGDYGNVTSRITQEVTTLLS